MKTHTPRIFMLLAAWLLSFQINAQLNFQVGYGLGFVNLSETKQLLDRYKLQNPWLSSGFQDIRFLNGFVVGFRQSWTGVSAGINWKYRLANTKADGLQPATNSSYTKEVFFNLQTYSLNVEVGGERIHFGTSLDLNILYIKEKHTGSSDKLLLSRETQYGSQFYINLNFPASNSCQISLQPFYFMPWKDFGLDKLQSGLQLAPEPGSVKESFRHFGISLIINNGPQSGN